MTLVGDGARALGEEECVCVCVCVRVSERGRARDAAGPVEYARDSLLFTEAYAPRDYNMLVITICARL